MLKEKEKRRIMNLKRTFRVLVITSITLLMFLTSIMIPVISTPSDTGTYEKFGPRVENVLLQVYGTLEGQFGAFETGEIDNIDWPLTPDLIVKYSEPPWNETIELGELSGMWYYEFDINCKPPDKWADKFWPTADVWFRRALAHAVNKTRIVMETMAGYGEPLETFFPPVLYDWLNPDPNIVETEGWNGTKYEYDMIKAAQILDDHGYQDWDLDGYREFSPDGGSTVYQMDSADGGIPLQVYIRKEDPVRKQAGIWLCDELTVLGIPFDQFITSGGTCWLHAWSYYDYHIYTGGWDIDPTPEYYYDAWHSKFDVYPRFGAMNYMRFHNDTFDYWAEQLKFAPTKADAQYAAWMCQEIVAQQVAGIPLYTDLGCQAHRRYYGSFSGEEDYAGKEWLGFVNAEGESFLNPWTALNAHPEGFPKGGKLRQGMLNDVESLNPVYADMFWDWIPLDLIYGTLTDYDPFNPIKDIPWLALNWTVTTAPHPNLPGNPTVSKIRFWLADNVLWHDGERFTADDVQFTLRYYTDAMCVLHYPWTELACYSEVINPYIIDVYANVTSYFALHWASWIPIVPEHIWSQVPANLALAYDPQTNTPPHVDPDDLITLPGGETHAIIGMGCFMYHSRVLGESIRLDANPAYYRELVKPDVCGDPPVEVPGPDGDVDLWDFGQIALEGIIFTKDPTWLADWGPACDANQDFRVGIDDLIEVGVRIGETGYATSGPLAGMPEWYGWDNPGGP